MVDVRTEILIRRPLAQVAAYAADPDNAPAWYRNIRSVEWKTAKPLNTASRIAFVAQFLGRKLAYTYEVTTYIPGAKLVMQTAEGPFPMQTTYTWTAIDATTTRMELRNAGRPSGFSRFMTPFLSLMMRKANQKDLQQLKTILENK